METTKKPVKFRWSLIIAFAMWIFTVICYQAGLTEPRVFTFVNTFIVPALVLVPIAPLSVARVVTHRWFMPGIAIWAGFTIPGIYLTGSWITGVGHRCDKVVMLGGVVAFFVLNMLWAVDRWQGRVSKELERSIDSRVRVASPTTGDATRETGQPVF